MRATAIIVMLAFTPWAWSETRPEPASVITSALADTQSGACSLAFEQAEDEARAQLGADDTARPELVSRTDERLGATEDDRFECRVETFWLERQALTAEQPAPETISEDPLRLGGLEAIEGRYQADCRASRRGQACREQIEAEAADALLNRLLQDEGLTEDDVALESDGFEGSQTFDYDQSDLTLTMDGTFYFVRVSPQTRPSQSTPPEPAPSRTEGELSRAAPREPGPMDNLDITLFYTWDGNESASRDDVALSARRWGLGLWVDNRVGVSAFWGDERAGIADSNGTVHNAGDRYDIRGVGVGYRLFDNRSVTVENMLHYVDAQPYSTYLNPDCASCTARNYEADDYFQASVNLKTNTESINLGWMLTWKLRDDLTQFDSLSGGWYVELQF